VNGKSVADSEISIWRGGYDSHVGCVDIGDQEWFRRDRPRAQMIDVLVRQVYDGVEDSSASAFAIN
jgi:hypothetical protein